MVKVYLFIYYKLSDYFHFLIIILMQKKHILMQPLSMTGNVVVN